MVPVPDDELSRWRPNIKCKAPSIREMAALSQTRKCIKRMHLVAETAVPIIYLVEKFIIRKVNKSIGPGK